MTAKICYGTWGFDGRSYGSANFQNCLKLALEGIALGIDFFDTSDFYGYGKSELVLGEVRSVLGCSSAYTVATKTGLLPHSSFSMPNEFSKRYMENSLQMSLSRLNVTKLDVWQLHSPSLGDLKDISKIFPWLETLKSSGTIGKIGISARSPKDAVEFVKSFDFDYVQVNCNLLDQRLFDTGLSEILIQKNIRLIARTPLAFGFLSGTINEDTIFHELDHRKKWPKVQLAQWSNGMSLYDDIRNDLGLSKTEFALDYVRSIPGVSYVNVGMMSNVDLYENVTIFRRPPLSDQVLEKIRHNYLKSDFAINKISKN
jgi:aryl-alcohol dehydrogenase-like predicted oxidoreductase